MSDSDNIQSLRPYLLTLMTESKKLRTEINNIAEELQNWIGRVKLAQEKGMADLQSRAEIRVGEIKQKLDARIAEKTSIDTEAGALKRKLLMMKNQPEMSVDADLLLAQFEMLLGETDELDQKFQEEEANAMLKNLKADLHKDGNE